MMKGLLVMITTIVLTACSGNSDDKRESSTQSTAEPIKETRISYPNTKKGDVVDTYFGTEVADPYRWLEDDLSEETGEWVKQQNQITFGYLDKIPYRNA